MPASNPRWLDTPVSYGAEFQLDSGAIVQLSTNRYGTGRVLFAMRLPGREWPMPFLMDDQWTVEVTRGPKPFREMVRQFMDEHEEQSRLAALQGDRKTGPRYRGQSTAAPQCKGRDQ